jgi:hypothetical protein
VTPEPISAEPREAALRCAWRGWPIVPGTPSSTCVDDWSVPLEAALPYRGPMSTNDVTRHWQHETYPLLLVTGLTIDVVEVRQSLGNTLLEQAGRHGPVALLPGRRWLFFVEAGKPSPDNDLLRRKVRHHGAGSQVPLPPTRLGQRPVRWHTDPASVQWRLFRQDQLSPALRPTAQPPPTPRPPAPASQLHPGHQHPNRAPSYQPAPRHHTLRVAGDRATVHVTFVHHGKPR